MNTNQDIRVEAIQTLSDLANSPVLSILDSLDRMERDSK